jgi:diguanylate cyclase (GGDEF)-like protein
MTIEPDRPFTTFDAASPDLPLLLRPVAVTRWTAQLVDPACERAYRRDRFGGDKRRLLMLMALVAVAGLMIFLGRFYEYLFDHGRAVILVPALVSIAIPAVAALVFRTRRTPQSLELAVVIMGSAGVILRLLMLSVQPNLLAMWLPLIVTVLFVIYLYLPVRFVVSVGLAAVLFTVAPLWWALAPHGVLNGPEIYRGMMWLLLANALGFTAANALQRSQRMQYAQSLVLQQLLSTDALTGIANRRRFDAALAREWASAARTHLPLSLLMIDVDYFKAFNDYCGHQRGDECLRRVARLLVAAAGRPGDLVARYGGEEFICLLPAVDAAGARAVAERLLNTVRAAAIAHPRAPSGRLTISVGVATTEVFSGGPDALVALADRLLYAAKDAGRDSLMSGMLGQRPVVQLAPARDIALAG